MDVGEPARRSLHVDAAYCAVSGLVAVVLNDPLARLFGAPAKVVVALGVVAVAWSLVLVVLSRREQVHRPLAVVVAANALAAAAIALLTVFAPAPAARLLLVAVALEVAALGAFQLRLLARGRARPR